MGWEIGFDASWQRDVGYGVPAVCDHPECNEQIHRGLAYVCGGEPFGGDYCGLHFCANHLAYWLDGFSGQVCERCGMGEDPFQPKPDVAEWVEWKLTHESWAAWRGQNPDQVKALQEKLEEGVILSLAALAGPVSD